MLGLLPPRHGCPLPGGQLLIGRAACPEHLAVSSPGPRLPLPDDTQDLPPGQSYQDVFYLFLVKGLFLLVVVRVELRQGGHHLTQSEDPPPGGRIDLDPVEVVGDHLGEVGGEPRLTRPVLLPRTGLHLEALTEQVFPAPVRDLDHPGSQGLRTEAPQLRLLPQVKEVTPEERTGEEEIQGLAAGGHDGPQVAVSHLILPCSFQKTEIVVVQTATHRCLVTCDVWICTTICSPEDFHMALSYLRL